MKMRDWGRIFVIGGRVGIGRGKRGWMDVYVPFLLATESQSVAAIVTLHSAYWQSGTLIAVGLTVLELHLALWLRGRLRGSRT